MCAILAGLFYTLEVRPTFRKALLVTLLIPIPAIFLYLFVLKGLSLVYLIIVTIVIFYIYTRKLRALFDAIILAIVSIFFDNFIEMIKYSLFPVDTPTITTASIGLYLLLFMLFIYGYRIVINKIWAVLQFSLIGQLLLIIVAASTMVVVYMNLFVALSRNLYAAAMLNLLMGTSYLAFMFILSVILIRNTRKEAKLKQKEIEQEQLFQYMQSLEQVNKDMQRFRHDYQNILLTFEDYLEKNDIQGLRTYFHDKILQVEKKTLQNHFIINQLDRLEIIELKGLLSTKVLMAEEKGIAVNIEIPETIENIEMDIIDLTRIVGILMDNAIEATTDLQEGELNVALLKQEDDSVLVIIENHFKKQQVQIDQLFIEGFSTKGAERGFGLATVRSIINQYPNITMNTRVENMFFINEIEVKETVQQMM
ncbi:sensor histidine kinase [Bacillus sp. JCM 19034]|uniref:sensor histidine kinase n=1 Tax=Bacillus sp. JCM 19034 TaxID=1481928 RepID=UPI000AF3A054|nr:GHKL domain-containing protein [Bacillus sp. JCM 19034]